MTNYTPEQVLNWHREKSKLARCDGDEQKAQLHDAMADGLAATLRQQAALAQNTPEGEAVAQVVAFGEIEGAAVIEPLGKMPPVGTKLYLHAERARVPDGYVLVPSEAGDQDASRVYAAYMATCRTRKAAYRIAIRHMAEVADRQLAAAPSHPKDAGEVRHG